ncbi:MAG: extracellular solute-binding protein [Actinobacteria bacterium]|nr:extracellular solute-binding protein [Actinomycetota bacterium]
MKRAIYLMFIVVLVVSVLLTFSISGCKREAAKETVATETAAQATTAAETTTTVETTAAETAAVSEIAAKAVEEYSKASAAGEKITLDIWDWQNTDNYAKAFDEIFALYKQKFPDRNIEFKREALAYDSYTQQMKAAVTGGEAPPIYEAYPGPEVVELASSGRLLVLDDFINNDSEWKSWLGGAFDYPELRSTDRKIYLIPVDVFVELVFYYKDMMKDAGIAEAPKTIEDLIAMVEPLKAKGKNVLATGLADDWQLYEPFYHMSHQQQPEGTDMVAQAMNGEISWQNEIFANSINTYKKLYDAGIWREDEMSLTYNIDAIGNFTSKKAWGFWEAGDWYVGGMNADDLKNDNIGAIPFPVVNGKAVPVYGAGTGLGYVVNIDAKYPNLTIEFLKFVNSPDCAAIFVKNLIHPAAGFTGVPAGVDVPKLFSAMLEAGVSDIRKSSPYYFNGEAQKAIVDGMRSVLLGQDNTENALKKADEITFKK